MTHESSMAIIERQRDLYVQALHAASRIAAASTEAQCYEILHHWGVEPPALTSHLRLEATRALADQLWEDIMAFKGSHIPTTQEMDNLMAQQQDGNR